MRIRIIRDEPGLWGQDEDGGDAVLSLEAGSEFRVVKFLIETPSGCRVHVDPECVEVIDPRPAAMAQQ